MIRAFAVYEAVPAPDRYEQHVEIYAFKEASRSPEFMETGKDAMEMGVPFQIHFAEIE